MNVSIRSIRYFLAAAETGSITKASRQMNISHSAIAAAIDAIEGEFGVQLILRHRAKGLELTPAGKTMVVRARHMIEEFDQFLGEGADLGNALSGSLHVGYFAPIAPAFFPKIITPLLEHGTDIYFQFTECDNQRAQDGLRNGDFDLSVFMDYAVHPDIHYKTLMEIPPYLIVPKGHHLASRDSVQFSDIITEQIILMDLPTTREYYQAMLDVVGIKPRLTAGANGVEMIRSLVAAGHGCSILNMCPGTTRTYMGSEIACVPLKEQPVRKLHLVLGYLQGNPRRLVREFEEHCQAFFTSEEAQALRVVSPDPRHSEHPR